RAQAQVGQQGGMQLVRQPPQLDLDLIEQLADPRQLAPMRLGQAGHRLIQADHHCGKQLSRFVVQGARDLLDLRFQSLIQPAQRGIGFSIAAQKHLIAGQRLGEQLAGRLDMVADRRRDGACAGQHFREHAMMQIHRLQQIDFRSEQLAAQAVRLRQHPFAGRAPLLFEQVAVGAHGDLQAARARCGSLFHARLPRKYRATRTRASSFPLDQLRSSSSAAACGWERTSLNSAAQRASTPSVWNMSVSPGAMGITPACRAGNCAPTTPPRQSKYSLPGSPGAALARTSTPPTLPTPSQATVSSAKLNNAKLSTTPRVVRRASWHLRICWITEVCGPSRSTVMAKSAARAASGPCPSPSATATRQPP